MSNLEINKKYGEKRKRVTLIGMIIFFAIVMGLLIFSGFSKSFGLTGLVSFSGDSLNNISNNGVYLRTSLTTPEIKLEQNLKRLEFEAQKTGISVDNSFYPEASNVVLIDFSGDFSFD